MIDMIDVDVVVARVQAETNLPTVVHSWTTEPDDDLTDVETPAALIFIGRERSEQARTLVPTTQRVTPTISVFIVARLEDYRDARLQVIGALMGWRPMAEANPIEHEDGGTAGFRGEHLWWRDDYVTWFTRTQEDFS